MLSEDPERLSLVYPCFISPYSSPEQIETAKILALQIYESPDTTPNEDAFITKISAYAEKHNVPYHETYLRFANGGNSVPLIIRTKYVEEWVTDDFDTDSFYMTIAIPDFSNWQKNISEMVRIREVSDSDIEYARNVLEFDDATRKTVIYYQMKLTDTYSGYYDPINNRVYVSSAVIICHEYIHYMHRTTVGDIRFDDSYRGESFACYFSANMDYEAYKYAVAAEETEGHILTKEEYFEELKDLNTEQVASMDASPTKELKKNDGWYGKYYSFSMYLVDLYGEYDFAQLMMFPERSDEIVGKPFDEIVADWDNYVSAFAD